MAIKRHNAGAKRETEGKGGRIPGAKKPGNSKNRTFAFYGRSGTGKTTLAATFPKPALLLDIRDRGDDSVADVKDLDVKQIETVEDLEDAYWWIKEHPDAYKTVILDTLSQLQEMAIMEIGGDKADKKGKKAGDWGSMTKRDWADVAGMMKEYIINWRDLRDLGVQVVFIAQDRVFNAGDDEVADTDDQIMPEVGPAMMPSVMKVLNASVDFIGNTFIRSKFIKKETSTGKKREVEQFDFCLRVGPNSFYITKVRKPKGVKAPSLVINPVYEDIIEAIKGE